MKIVYVGGMPHGHIKNGDNLIDFKRGEPVEVPDKLGRELVSRDDWKEPKKETK